MRQDDDFLLQVRFLEPSKLRFGRAPSGALRMTLEGEWSCLKVVVVRAFPRSHPEEYLSFRDEDRKELGMLRRLKDLPEEYRKLVEEELYRRYFCPQIERIVALRERFGVAEWKVETSRGPHTFLTRNVRDSITELGPHHLLITDVDGNRFEVRDLAALDARSTDLLMGLM